MPIASKLRQVCDSYYELKYIYAIEKCAYRKSTVCTINANRLNRMNGAASSAFSICNASELKAFCTSKYYFQRTNSSAKSRFYSEIGGKFIMHTAQVSSKLFVVGVKVKVSSDTDEAMWAMRISSARIQ